MNSDNGYVVIDNSKWYNIQIVANITETATDALQSIYVTDKSTGKIISCVENVPLNIAVPYCNLLSVGGSSTIDIDNIIVMSPNVSNTVISGNPYPMKSSAGDKTYQYKMKGVTSEGVVYNIPNGASWSLDKSVAGVQISDTGLLTISNSAPVAPIVIKSEYSGITKYYLVEIEG